jgi:ethanolamine utilization microcompartment shell protein EutL
MQVYKEVKMTGEKPCCAAAAARMVKKLTLPDGSQVGIKNLENILKEVADVKLTDDSAIKKELLQRVKIYNYVAPGAETDYSKALLSEYEKLFEKRV